MTLTEWINFLNAHGITEAGTLELFNTAVSNHGYADVLSQVLTTLQKLKAEVNTDLELYFEIMSKPSRAENNLALLEALGDSGARIVEEYDLYMTVADLCDEKPRLLATINLLKQHHLELPECAEHYQFALTTPISSVTTVLKWIEDFGAILPQDNWLYLLALKNASFIASRENIFALLKQRGITTFENGKIIETLLQQYYQPAQIFENFATLDSLGLNIINNEDFYVAATGWLVSSDLINPAFEQLRELGANLTSDPELYQSALKSCSFITKFSSGFAALKKAGIEFTPPNKLLYLACLDTPETADQLEQGLAILAEMGIDYPSYPALYETMIRHSDNTETTAKTFSMLKGIGACMPECASLYVEAMRQKVYFTKLAHGFGALMAFDYSLPADITVYEKIITLSHDADKLYPVLQLLKERDIDCHGNQEVVLAAMDSLSKQDTLTKVIAWFKKMNINGVEHPELYLAAINNLSIHEPLLAVWDLLAEAGFGLENKDTYLLVTRHLSDKGQLENVLRMLIDKGAKASSHKDLFTAVIKSAHFGECFLADCILLSSMGITVKDWDFLYLHVAKCSSDELSEVLQKMLALDFNILEQSDLIQAIVMDNRHGVSFAALTWLENRGFTIRNHPQIYSMFFLNKPCLCDDPYVLKKVEDAIELYLQDQFLLNFLELGFTAQNQEIKEIITTVVNKHNEMTQGPLNKSAATHQFEYILKKLASEGIEQVDMSYDPTYGYVLRFNAGIIYLNELMRLVNFSHLELDREQHIIPLGEFIQQLVPDFHEYNIDNPHVVLNSLPLVVQQALYVYTSWYYKNINRTFRGLVQSTDERYVWIEPANGRDNLLANFLCGCLVNWAAAELPRALIDSPERRILARVILDEVKRLQQEDKTADSDAEELLRRMKNDKLFFEQLLTESLRKKWIMQEEYQLVAPLFKQLDLLFPRYQQISRIENIKEAELDGHFNVKRARGANPVHLPSVMSTSSKPVSELSIGGEEITHFARSAAAGRPIISRGEHEIIFPLGASFLYSSTAQGFFAREVNSPDVVPHGGYWSSLAIIEANEHHLQNLYQDEDNHIIVDDIAIARANHGLPHEYRVMSYIDMVIDYYSLHAQDEEFKDFCRHISFKEREWLRVAAAYSVTGRESEIGAAENLARYDRYREASCNHLIDFLKKRPPAFQDQIMAERIVYLVRWMGNPFFETESLASANPVDEKERKHRNFLNRILSTAHKLDLPRCYEPAEFERAMSLCRGLSQHSEQQQQDYIRMERYAIELIRAHGDMLRTDINTRGELTVSQEDYRSPFGKVQSMRMLHEVSSSVSRPKFDKVEMEQASLSAPAA